MGSQPLTRHASPSRGAVLVVDDDASFGAMVADVLTERGFEAVWEAQPERAIERAQRGAFGVAVVDLQMPGMDGLALVERLRATAPHMQFLILTGHGSLDSAAESVRQGLFDYLRKSEVDLGMLERRVRQAFERSTLLTENRELVLRLKTLLSSSTALAAETHADRLFEQALGTARGLTGASAARGLVFERSADGSMLVRAAVGDGAAELLGMRLGPGQSLAAQVALDGQARLTQAPEAEAGFLAKVDRVGTDLPGWIAAPLVHRGLFGVLLVAGGRRKPFGEGDREALQTLGAQAAVALDNAQQHERLHNFYTHASDLLVRCLEDLDIHLPGHARGVAALADLLTRRLELPEAERRSVHFCALLHDIGKLALPREVREAPEWNDAARIAMREHPRLGAELLQPITLWGDVLAGVHAHHERWDGKGYPRGLVGEEIPLAARIVALADTFDAICRRRLDGSVGTAAEALKEIEACAGKQFDPQLARLLVAAYRESGDPRSSLDARGA